MNESPSLQHIHLNNPDDAFTFDCGAALSELDVAYTTKGVLSPRKDNVILICHALTGDQFIADQHPITGKKGWWSDVVRPGGIIDTRKFFVVCSNVLGGCLGTTGPASINPATAKPYGLSFPEVSIGDMVRVQKKLLEHLGIETLFAVIGGSMGAMQALDWIVRFPDKVRHAVVIAGAARHSPQNIAFHESGRAAILSDPNFAGGHYYETPDQKPERGLAVARMLAHITYLSEPALQRKFGRKFRGDLGKGSQGFRHIFEVESYLRYQGANFVKRFDANSYLYLTRAMDDFDLAAECDGHLIQAFEKVQARTLVVSFSSDWLFPTAESKKIVRALAVGKKHVSAATIESDGGHDSFLLKVDAFYRVMNEFIEGSWRRLEANP